MSDMDKMSIYESLASVQSELKAPKGQYNSFGKYAYRSCEDVLEAVKPLLKAHGLALHLSDEPVMVGEWHYIKATATVVDFSGQQVSVSAYAREAAEKKGMDDSQITGTASSYACKYALNGLFCIDDAKDADTDDYQNQSGKKPSKPAPKPAPPPVCACCGKPVTGIKSKDGKASLTTEQAADRSLKKYGRILCMECARKQPKEYGGLTHA